MNFKKITIILYILLIAVIFYGGYLKLENNPKDPLVLRNSVDSKTEFIPYEKRTWDTYFDDRYKYSLKFPTLLNVFPIHEQSVVGTEGLSREGVSFGDPALDDYWVMSVSVLENTSFLNVDEWLQKEGKKFKHQRPIVEKRITLDGYDAIVTHMQSDYELDEVTKNEKNTVFIKNGNLFEIRTRFSDYANHERVWGSFKFN